MTALTFLSCSGGGPRLQGVQRTVEPKLQAVVYDILPSIWQSLEEGAGKRCFGVWVEPKLQTLVYDILPSTTAVFSYAIGSRKLSANEQFFVGAQTLVVSLLQTAQIISDVCFVTDHVAYVSSNETTAVVEAGRMSYTSAVGVWVEPTLRTSVAFRHLPPNSARFSYASK